MTFFYIPCIVHFFFESLQDKRKTDLCSIDVSVPKEFIGLTKGKKGRNLQLLETKSETKIRFFSNKGESGVFTISGSHRNCERARALMLEKIVSLEKNLFDLLFQ